MRTVFSKLDVKELSLSDIWAASEAQREKLSEDLVTFFEQVVGFKQLLDHKSIQNKMLYTQPVNFEDDRFPCKTAVTVEEAKEFIEAGFKHVSHMHSVELFRKPK